MKKNDFITLTFTATSSEGVAIGRHEGLVIFVPNGAEGDTARVKILKVKKNMAFGKIEEILTPSSSRTELDCAVSERCGGCVYRHITYNKECEIKWQKVADAMQRIGGVSFEPKPIIAAKSQMGYRNKAQLPISQNKKTGFFAKHSHRIIETNSCLLTPEIFSKISVLVENWCQESGVSIYNEETNSGLLRHLYIREAQKTGEIMVYLIINGSNLPAADKLLSSLKELLGDRLVSLGININREKTNVILGNECITLYGKDYITDELCGIKVRISPLSFYQVNRDMCEILYKKAAEYLNPQGKTIIDLYCGAGTIGLSMAERAKRIIGVEIVPEAVNDANLNAKNNGIENAEFICGDAADAAKTLAKRGITADAVILDPPRKGCEKELLETVANEFCPRKIIYISCDVATLARDTAVLEPLGYTLKEYTPVDLFPKTHHVETIALFVR